MIDVQRREEARQRAQRRNNKAWARFPKHAEDNQIRRFHSISGLVVEYIVAIDVTRVRFPADACIARAAILKVRGSVVVSISACHAEDPGSIPGGGVCPVCVRTTDIKERESNPRGETPSA